MNIERPIGITLCALLFLVAGVYLIVSGTLMLSFRGTFSMTLGSPLLNGLELSGPYMFLLAGLSGVAVGLGLLELNNWARRAGIVVAMLGMIMLIPVVSAAAVDFRPGLFWSGLGLVVRMIVVWFLFQTPVAEVFRKN